mmetsp:Transcript_41051/g.72171  ORF Transcript_41051/g.72171 Transcript_41051/m.72171 type:complete len:198 (+) Transcript_41051:75-668(+)
MMAALIRFTMLGFLVCFHGVSAVTHDEDTTCSVDITAARGSALLQTKTQPAKEASGSHVAKQASNTTLCMHQQFQEAQRTMAEQGLTVSGGCSETSGVDPMTASLDAAGFYAITTRCCPWKTETWFNRLLMSMDYKICSKDHIQGLMHWFTCVPALEFSYILEVIANGQAQGCKYWAKTWDSCPAIAGTYCDNPCKP